MLPKCNIRFIDRSTIETNARPQLHDKMFDRTFLGKLDPEARKVRGARGTRRTRCAAPAQLTLSSPRSAPAQVSGSVLDGEDEPEYMGKFVLSQMGPAGGAGSPLLHSPSRPRVTSLARPRPTPQKTGESRRGRRGNETGAWTGREGAEQVRRVEVGLAPLQLGE